MTESNTIKQIRATCENAPTISQDSSFADACKCSKALNEIMEILDLAREAEQEEPERNGDGDTLEDIKAVWKRLKGGSIEMQYATGVWRPLTDLYNSDLAELPLCKLRITAKHADRFDPDCMSFETWARAAIGRGIMPSRKTGVGTVTYSCLDDILTDEYMDGEWTALPRAEAPAAGLPIDCEGDEAPALQVDGTRLHELQAEAPTDGEECEHGLDKRLLCGDCQKAYEAQGGEAEQQEAGSSPPSLKRCPMCYVREIYEDEDHCEICEQGIKSGQIKLPNVESEQEAGNVESFSAWRKRMYETGEHGCATGECPHSTQAECDLALSQAYLEYRGIEHDRPAFDVQAAVDRLTSDIQWLKKGGYAAEQPITLVRNALQAVIGGGE